MVMGVLRVTGLTVALALVGCAGSTSESPWPVEPLDTDPAPQGEAPPAGDATDVGTPSDWDDEADGGTDEEP